MGRTVTIATREIGRNPLGSVIDLVPNTQANGLLSRAMGNECVSLREFID